MKELITTKQLAEKLNVTERYIYVLRNNGLPYKRIGSSIRFDQDDVTEWIEQQSVKA